MDYDLLPKYFDPHLTLVNTKQIKKRSELKKGFEEVNNNMKDNSSFYTTKMNRKKKK